MIKFTTCCLITKIYRKDYNIEQIIKNIQNLFYVDIILLAALFVNVESEEFE
jgi:hypothetical protein